VRLRTAGMFARHLAGGRVETLAVSFGWRARRSLPREWRQVRDLCQARGRSKGGLSRQSRNVVF